MKPVTSILVLGGGSAGFLSAITLKKWLPRVGVTVVRSSKIGIIGVGEGTTVGFTTHLHGHLGIDPGEFLREVDPIWKLGGRFTWGKRSFFDYGFCQQLSLRYPNLSKATGFYFGKDMTDCGLHSAMMQRNRVFVRNADGSPQVDGSFAYHLENETLVCWLQKTADQMGIGILDGTVKEVKRDESGVSGLMLENGRELAADLFIDASGFKSVLLEGAMRIEPVDYKSSLWCDRAIVGGWDRQEEPIQPYTTQDTMDAGWAWRIEHRQRINRGYVFSSAYLSDSAAENELRSRNPKLGPAHIVRFRSGRHQSAWVGNVVAIGNAYGFVEPLEATALGMICHFAQILSMLLHDAEGSPRESQRTVFNNLAARAFDNIRWFLSIHYKFNDRLDTPFWRDCREKVDFSGAEHIVEYFRENGPTLLLRSPILDPADPFGTEGYLSILLGLNVSYQNTFAPSDRERKIWNANLTAIGRLADQALGIEEATERLKSKQWEWKRSSFLANPAAVVSLTFPPLSIE